MKTKLFTLLFAIVVSIGTVFATEGALPGLFSVSAEKKVQFSQGNMQYQASTDTWRFAENQYDMIGDDNANISDSYSGWIDLFGWGTGDYPTKSSKLESDYYTFVDWGVNAISNGGNEANLWRTLTKDEWVYLFINRTNAAILFGLGNVNGINGTIILPDNWSTPQGVSFTQSTTQGMVYNDGYYRDSNPVHYSDNTYTIEQWSVMEQSGAVFLPAAGYRWGKEVLDVEDDGFYWSATHAARNIAYYIEFGSNSLGYTNGSLIDASSVRLIHDAPCILASGTCGASGDNLTWELSCDSVLTISGTGAMADYNGSNQPWHKTKNAIKSITIEYGVTSIGQNAFINCYSLTSIEIPNSVTSIGFQGISDCTGLTSIEIPNSVTSIGDHAFHSCSGLISISVEAGNTIYDSRENCNAIIETASNTLIAGCQNTIIPNGVTSIGNWAFEACSGLTSIVIPNSVTSIYDNAFVGCSNLTSITIPNSVTSIGGAAFGFCSALTSISVEAGNPVYDSRENCNAIIETASNTIIAGCQNTVIPSNITSIGRYAFYGCLSLTSVFIPNSVTGLGDYAFFNCIVLTSIEIPNSVTSIGDDAFGNCWHLTNIDIPNSVTSIGKLVFQNCYSLTSITCEAVTPPVLGEFPFSTVNKSIPLYVPAGCIAAYQAADQWKDFTNIRASGSDALDPGHPLNPGNYRVTLTVDDEAEGSVSGSGMYPHGSEVTITATPNAGYEFVSWSDGVTDNPRTITVMLDTTIGTMWRKLTYTVTFLDEDGTQLSQQTVAYGSAAIAPEVEVPQCRALAWDTDFSNVTSDLTVTAVWSAAPLASGTCGAQGDNLTWELSCDSVLTIRGTGEMMSNPDWAGQKNKIKSIVINEGVTSIGQSAFSYCQLTSVTIPSSLVRFDANAFLSSQLDAVYISDLTAWCNITVIGDYANPLTWGHNLYLNGTQITDLVIPDGISRIEHSFHGGNFTSVTFPNTIVQIGKNAFRGCNFASIAIPESVTYIGDAAFNCCNNLTSIYIPAGITHIEGTSFSACRGLNSIVVDSDNPKYDSRDNCNAIIETNTNTLVGGCNGTIIPNSVTKIGDAAFYGYEDITSITIPSSITAITGRLAFYACRSLNVLTCEAITPPVVEDGSTFWDVNHSLTLYVPAESVDAYKAANLWKDFTNIQAIPCILASGTCGAQGDNLTWELSCDSVLTISGTGAMADCKKNQPWRNYQKGIKSVIIGNGVTSIGHGAFWSCSGLKSVTIPNSVTSIEEKAFYLCSSLTSVTIPNSVTSIGWDAFSSSGLTSLIIPNSVTSIAGWAFYGCRDLTSVTIPNSVTSIGSAAFGSCSRLSSMSVETGNTVYDSRDNCNAIIQTEFNMLIAGCKNTMIPNSVTIIDAMAFYGCYGLTSVTIPNSVTRIGDSAFSGCDGLTSMTIPNSVTSIGEHAFYTCESLTSVNIPNSVTSIGSQTFMGCRSLTSVTIPNSVTSIGGSAFEGCSGLNSITIGNRVTSIDYYAFRGCTGLLSLTCEATTPPTLGSGAFNSVDKSIPVYVSCTSIDVYKAASIWGEFTNYQAVDSIHVTYSITSSSDLAGTVSITNKSEYCDRIELSIQATEKSGYEFAQWSDGVTSSTRTITVTGDTTITAEWVKLHAITWKNADGTTLATDTVREGATPTYSGETPTKAADEHYTYAFSGWSPEVVAVTGDATYTAVFEAVAIPLPIVEEATISQDCNQNGLNAMIAQKNSINGHEYVDLGLTSGLLWATCNVGAEVPEQIGGYYSWGETQTKTSYTLDDYLYKNNPISLSDISGSQYDAARANWGGEWRMPTRQECNELISHCTIKDTTINNVIGKLVIGANNNCLFVPASGYIAEKPYYCQVEGSESFWTSTAGGSYAYRMWEWTYISFSEREQGFQIRPVCSKGTPTQSTASASTYYTLTLYANGCETPNTFVCAEGQEVTIKAIPQDHYHCVRWSDGVTDASRTITVTKDSTLTAEFAIPSVEISNVTIPSIACGDQTFNLEFDLTYVNQDGELQVWLDDEATKTTVDYIRQSAEEQIVHINLIVPVDRSSAVHTLHYNFNKAGYSSGSLEVQFPSVPEIISGFAVTVTDRGTCDNVLYDLTGTVTYTGEATGNLCVAFGERKLVLTPPSGDNIVAFTLTNLTEIVSDAQVRAYFTDQPQCVAYSTAFNSPTKYVLGDTLDVATICGGDSLLWRGRWLKEAGTYYDTTRYADSGCDSLRSELYLSVITPVEYAESATICGSEPFEWLDKTYTTAGTYRDTVQSIGGCDSVYYILNLSVAEKYEFEETYPIFETELPYTVHGCTYTKAGTYECGFTTVNGCDSIYHITIVVLTTGEDSLSVDGVISAEDLDLGVNSAVTINAQGHLVVSSPVYVQKLTLDYSDAHHAQVTGIGNIHAEVVEVLLNFPTPIGPVIGHWYSFAVPFEVSVATGIRLADSDTPARYGYDFVIDEYDGIQRATLQHGWKRVGPDAILRPGCMYMFASAKDATSWILTAADPSEIIEHTEADISENSSAIGSNHSGWNGIANPMFANATADMSGVTLITTYNNVLGVYEICEVSEFVFMPSTPFLVQVAESATFGFNDVPIFAPRRSQADNEPSVFTKLMLTDADEIYTDKAYISFVTDKEEDTYLIGHDLQKMAANSQYVHQLWLEAYGMQLSAYEAPLGDEPRSIPIGIYAPAAGNYTLQMSNVPDNISISLTENGQPVWDIAASAYTLNLPAGNSNSYALYVQRVPEVTTDYMTGNVASVVQKVIMDDQIFIIRNGKTYNVTGIQIR